MESYDWQAKELELFSISVASLTFQPHLCSLQHIHSKLESHGYFQIPRHSVSACKLVPLP